MQKKKILLIEDDEMLVDLYKEKLKIAGFRVITAGDGKKAMIRIKEQPDLILLDILMPEMNGFEVLKKIKTDKAYNNIPVIVLTNIGSESIDNDKNLALSLGAKDYLVKALNTPDQIVQRIEKIIA